MFQIVSTLMEEVPDFASEMKKLQGVQPRLKLLNSPWGHGIQCVDKCDCLMSDRVDTYVHCLIPRAAQADLTDLDNIDNSGELAAGFTFNEDCGYPGRWPCGDQSPLYLKDRVRMAGYCWPSMCGGSLAV